MSPGEFLPALQFLNEILDFLDNGDARQPTQTVKGCIQRPEKATKDRPQQIWRAQRRYGLATLRRHTVSPSSVSAVAMNPARAATLIEATCSGWMLA